MRVSDIEFKAELVGRVLLEELGYERGKKILDKIYRIDFEEALAEFLREDANITYSDTDSTGGDLK